jgi:hypothetical protein
LTTRIREGFKLPAFDVTAKDRGIYYHLIEPAAVLVGHGQLRW